MSKRHLSRQHPHSLHIWLLSNLPAQSTGIEGTVVWISAGEFAIEDAQYGPRILVAVGDKCGAQELQHAVLVRLTRPPKIVGPLPAEIRRKTAMFVEKNRDILVRHWDGELGSEETLALLERV